MIQDYSKVYKPSYTIEFDRKGEILLFSATPNRDKLKLLNVYPFNMFDQLSVGVFFGFFSNIFGLNWASRVIYIGLIPFLMNMRRNHLEER